MLGLRNMLIGENGRNRNLIKLAFAKGKLDELDIEYINRNFSKLNISDSEIKSSKNKIESLESAVPAEKFERYKLLFGLMKIMMIRDIVTDRSEKVLKGVAEVLMKNANNVNELVHFLKFNIKYGNSTEESYSRLGYLID